MRKRVSLPGLAGAALLGVAVLTGGCASPRPDADAAAANDPLEPLNRKVYGFNKDMRALFIRPSTEIYRGVVPAYGRNRVSDFLSNLRGPVIFVNDVLQGEWDRAADTLARFGLNSTVGVLGVHDVAAEMGIPPHDEDFGQTLGVWGVGDGPYLVLPILGPSNMRDTGGLVVDSSFDPVTLAAVNSGNEWFIYSRTGLAILDEYDRVLDTLEEIENTSLDPYAALRSLYAQNRRAQIANDSADFGTLESLEAPEMDMDMDFDMDMDSDADARPNDAPGSAPR